MERKNFLKALIIITLIAFVINWILLGIFDTETAASARRLVGLEAKFGMIALQKTSFLFFLFILFYYSVKLEESLFWGSFKERSLASYLFFAFTFTLILFPFLLLIAALDGGEFIIITTYYFINFSIVISCSIFVNFYNKSLDKIRSLKTILSHSVSSTFLIALLAMTVIGVFVGSFSIPTTGKGPFNSIDGLLFALFIQPFLIIFNFGLGIYLYNKFVNQNISKKEKININA